MISETIAKLGFPTYIIYPLAIAKILGLVAIWTKKSEALKEWAYTGFFFNFVLALTAHININDGEFAPASVAIVLLLVSYFFEKKV
ncbi:MAG: DoxX family protein [Chitinophagales bacterium]